MSGILDLLGSSMGKQLINGTSQQLGLDKGSATSAMSAAIPLLLGAMKNNAGSPEGAAGLLSALGNSKHSGGGMLDNLGSILGGGGIDDDVVADGGKILGHLFGGQEDNAANALGKSSGIDAASAMNLLKVAAPFVMSYLGKKTQSQGVSDQNGIGNLLGSMLGSGGGAQQDLAGQIQSFAGNDSTIESLAGMLTGGGKGGGIGGLLGKLMG